MIFTPTTVSFKKIFNVRNIIIAVLFIALLFSGVRNCSVNRELNNKIDSLTLANQTLDSMNNAKGQTIYTQTAIVTNQQEEIKRLSDEKFDLQKKNSRLVKQVLAYQSETTETRIDSVEVPFLDSAERKRFSDSIEANCKEVLKYIEDSTIRVPRVAADSNANYSINITTTKTGNIVNSLVIPDSTYFRIIEKKGGFFRKVQVKNSETGEVKKKLKFHVPKTIEFQSFHTNPLVHVTGQTSVYYVPKKKFGWLWKAALIGGGIYIGTKL